MTRDEFSELLECTFDEVRRLSSTKGQDYAPDHDELANFKRAAERVGWSPQQVWAVFAGKHWDAILTYCREGQVQSEPIEGRLHDLILYSVLLLAMVQEPPR